MNSTTALRGTLRGISPLARARVNGDVEFDDYETYYRWCTHFHMSNGGTDNRIRQMVGAMPKAGERQGEVIVTLPTRRILTVWLESDLYSFTLETLQGRVTDKAEGIFNSDLARTLRNATGVALHM